MGADQTINWAAAAASALEWWRDAGVDVLVEDESRDWLAPIVRAPLPASDRTPPTEAMPQTLADFLRWRGGADLPDAGWSGAAISAEGPSQAELMVLTDCPERDDRGALLGGPAGRLLDRMLAAIGAGRAGVHLAAVCLRRPMAGKLPRDAVARLGEVARHHVALVAPRRLLLLGDGTAQAVLGLSRAEAAGRSHFIDHDAGRIRVVATHHPRFLLEKPACKAESWRDLRLLMRESEDE